MTTNEAGKQKEQSMTFTFKGPISWQWKEDKEKPYLSEFIIGCSRPPIFEDVNTTNQPLGIDELIARHKATLVLLAKPAQPEISLQKAPDAEGTKKIVERVEKLMNENGYRFRWMTQEEIESADKTMNEWKPEPEPAECECVDKAKLQEYLADQIEKSQKDKAYSAGKEWFTDAARNVHREFAFSAVKEAIAARRFDRAPCKPEPVPEPIVSGEVIGSIGDGVTVKLDDGRIVTFRGQVQNPPGPAPSKPALDKGTVLDAFDRVFPHPELSGAKCIDLLRFCENVRCGRYDLPATDRPREHKCRCSTANLVEQLRSRASVADGIDVTDLDADQLLTVGWNRPATVIMVRKEDRS